MVNEVEPAAGSGARAFDLAQSRKAIPDPYLPNAETQPEPYPMGARHSRLPPAPLPHLDRVISGSDRDDLN